MDGLPAIRDRLQDLLRLDDGPFFDADGVLRGAINVRTVQPFTAEWSKTQTQPKLPEPLAVNYAQATMYEDSWDSIGEYLEYLRARYDVTGEPHLRDEMRRCAQLVIDVYREDNPPGIGEWETRNGFFRRLYAGRHGTWPYPETLGTDQHAPLFAGLRFCRDLLDDAKRKAVDDVLVGSLDWYARRNFAYIYRGTIIHSIEWGEHALSFFIPALLWAHEVTGKPSYLKWYERLHQDYICNPEHYLKHGGRAIVYYQHAFKWSTWIPWLCKHAPNADFYDRLFPQFVEWYTTLLTNCLPSGLGYDYDNNVLTNDPFPAEWIDQPLQTDPSLKTHDGYDIMNYLARHRRPPLRQLRYLTSFAIARPDAVDVAPIVRILSLCNTLDHFTYWFDPHDRIVPPHMNHRSWSLQAQFVCSWLAAYWRLVKLGKLAR
jgi:hypothetical protein